MDEIIKPPPSLSNTFFNMRPKTINMTMININFFRIILFEIESLPYAFPIKTVFIIQRSKPYVSITRKS
jgi:hypothetical protein